MAGENGQVVSGGSGGGFPARAIWTRLAVAVVIIAAVVGVGCGELNQVPTINSLIANPNTVVEGGSSTVTCTATDPDADTLTYTWSYTGGTHTGTGGIITWIAPSAVGTYTITVTVADGNGGTASDDVVVTVISGNSPPVIASVVATDPSVMPGGSTTVTCTATDADGDTLTYTWSAPDGGSLSGSGASVTWHAPAAETTYTVEVTVSDGQGGTDSGSTNIVVVFVATTGSIKIQSVPVGAKVYLDGVDTGSVTGLMGYTIASVSAGSHTIKLRYDYLKDREETVTVPAGGTAEISWDLTLNPAPALSLVLQPNAAAGKDTYIYRGTADTNEGTNTGIYAAGSLPSAFCRLFIEFDLSSVPGSVIVTDAKLGLYYFDDQAAAIDGPIGAYPITQSWDEMVLTWNNQPGSGTTPVATTQILQFTVAGWRYWDIDTLVQGWVDGSISDYGVTLRDTDESTAEQWKGFRSSDWGTAVQRPKLTIYYYDPTP